MNKLKELLNTYFWLIVIVFLIVVFVLTHSIYSNWQDGAANRTVSQQQTQANTAVKQGANAQNAAVNSDIERRSEDARREKTITPKLDESRRRSNSSKAELDAAKRRYENAKNNTANLSVDSIDNCRKLKELFPDVRFNDCGIGSY